MRLMTVCGLVFGAAALWCAALVSAGGAADGANVETTIERVDGRMRLVRGGEVYPVRGVGGREKYGELLAIGGNAVRTWGQQELGQVIVGSDGERRRMIDEMHRLGIGVCAGFWMEHERGGFDYTDPEQTRAQLERLRRWVETYKDHPAVLMWAIGNEVEIETAPEVVFPELNRAAKMVKEIDPTRPTLIVIAEIGEDKARLFKELCPDVDLLGVNSYAGLSTLPERLREQGYDGPYVVTEYGTPGHWEVGRTAWGAPYEPTSAEKAAFLERNIEEVVDRDPGCIGGFAFKWGLKQERTATWYGMFLADGSADARVDVLAEAWGRPRSNKAPWCSAITLSADPARVRPGALLRASIEAGDPDGDALSSSWEIREQSTSQAIGGDRERVPESYPGLTLEEEAERARLRAPERPGAYRLFVFVRDGQGNFATANLPFLVVEEGG